MTLESFIHVRGPKGGPMAICSCEECDEQITIVADLDQRSGSKNPKPRVGQCVQKLQAKGWSYVSGVLRCPTCTASRRGKPIQPPKEEDAMTKQVVATDMSQLGSILGGKANTEPSPSEAPLPEPTGKQTRLIMMMLEEVYDDQHKRYRGDATDKTVAEELGDGIRPGWVAKLRDQFFGPAGGNEEMERLRADIAAWMGQANEWASRADRAMQECAQAKAGMEEARGKVKELSSRLEAICRAVGPKAGR